MNKILRITAREYKAAVKTKGFIIGLILLPILMSGGLIAFKISEAKVDTTDKILAVIDHSGITAQALIEASDLRNTNEVFDKETGKKRNPAYPIEMVSPDNEHPREQRQRLSDRIRNGELHAFIEIGASVAHPGDNPKASRISYHSKNSMTDELRRWVEWPINNKLRQLRLKDAGVEESKVKDLFRWIPAEGLGLASRDEDTGELKDAERVHGVEAIGIPIFMMMLMYMMILMGAQPLLNSVMEEKNQRIAEVILGSIRPFEFMMGKILGAVGVALTASSFYIIGGLITLNYMDMGNFVNYLIFLWFFTYLILALFLYGAINAALGSMCNDIKDLQSMAFPAMLPIISAMFMIGPVIKEPMSDFATIISLLPPFTPLLMLLRQSMPGGVPAWQPWVGMAGVLAFSLLSVFIGSRIFRVGILMQGAPLKIGNIVRWAIRG